MKKFLFSFFAFALIFTLAACGSTGNTGTEPPAPEETSSSSTEGASASQETPNTEESSSAAQMTVPADAEEKSDAETDAPNADAVPGVRVAITIGEQVLYAELDDSQLAKDFVDLLPQTISMSRVGGGREFYGSLNGSLDYDEADMQTTFENGDLAYWFSGNGLCLLYNNQVERPEIESGVIVFGKITSDLSPLYELSDRIEATVTLEETMDNSQSLPETTKITMTAGGIVITAELDNSDTSRAFLETLPRTISMNRYDDREYYGRIEAITENGEVINDFENGDVTYYPAGPSFAVFFAGEERSNQSGLIRMGKVTSDLSAFDGLGDVTEMVIEIAE